MTSNSHGARLREAQERVAFKAAGNRRLRLAVDFDATICDLRSFSFNGVDGEPHDGAREVLRQARNNGDTIIVHTCRARPTETVDGKFWVNTTNHVAAWMDHHDIPYDEITALKPIADVYLDDKAIQFIDWHQASADLMMLRRRGPRG